MYVGSTVSPQILYVTLALSGQSKALKNNSYQLKKQENDFPMYYNVFTWNWIHALQKMHRAAASDSCYLI